MNKTVNINLAGIFFHIDEDAYAKLQRYLEAIKRSFTDSQGRSEIISDIEARIAELFNERVKHEKQVIGNKEVDEVITIMGQPEDYLVDDEIFEDEPKQTYHRRSNASKKLFRDTENSYVGGVSSGLGHYFGIEPIWIRLVWILLIFGAGTGVFLYILLWILLPEAVTTSDKLMMRGEPVNITNIEKKIKDGFDNVSQTVSDTVRHIDLPKQGNRIKSGSQSFFDAIGNIFMFFLKVFAKFIGIILIIIGLSSLIALAVFCLSLGTVDFLNIPFFDTMDSAFLADTPIWLASLLIFFAVGIPFFFVFYLGLKILISNLKSIGNIAKFTLFGLWLVAFAGLIVVGIRQANEHAFDASVVKREALNVTANDTLMLKMSENDTYFKSHSYRAFRHNNGFRLITNENDEKTIYSRDVTLIVLSTKDSLASISIEKNAEGSDYSQAKRRAANINYQYLFNEKVLVLDTYLTTAIENKFRDQEIEIILYLPEGTTLYVDDNVQSFLNSYSSSNNIISSSETEHYLNIINNGIICSDCNDDDYKLKIDVHNDKSSIKIDDTGLKIKTNDSTLDIDDDGLRAKSEEVNINIDENGIEITTDDN